MHNLHPQVRRLGVEMARTASVSTTVERVRLMAE
jgi:hypothetical protein